MLLIIGIFSLLLKISILAIAFYWRNDKYNLLKVAFIIAPMECDSAMINTAPMECDSAMINTAPMR